MKSVWMLAVSGALLSTAALAQTATQTPAHPPAPTAPAATSSTAQSHETLRQQLKADMQQAGFTNVTVRPDSFLVQAKDKAGNPVTMMVDPDSLTEIVEAGAANGNTAMDQTGGSFTTVPGSTALGSKIIGTEVRNNNNQDIGKITDIAYSGHEIKAYIVGVGGFLGIGDHDVAVKPSALHVTYDSNAKTWHATMNTTVDQLKAAPEYKSAT
jgi:opacity protein-like surface antigen